MAKQKKIRKASHHSGGETSSRGVMSSLRGGFKNLAGTGKEGPRTRVQRTLDVLIWVAVAAALAYFAYQRFR